MKPRIIGVNGINSNGSKNTDILLKKLREHGYETVDFNYPCIGLFKAVFAMSFWRYTKTLESLSKQLFEESKDGDHVVAHSFGCAVVWHCMTTYGRNFGKAWLIAPAISLGDGLIPLYNQTEQITFVHNPHDRALKSARFAPWIDMSKIGLTGFNRVVQPYEPKYRNLPMPYRYLRGETKDFFNHNYAFGERNLPALVADINDEIS